MKKFVLILISLQLISSVSRANHITGGQIYYTFQGMVNGSYRYHVTLNLFRDCNAPPNSAQLDPTAAISIFDRATNVTVFDDDIDMAQMIVLNLGSPSPCITNPPPVCYQVGYYEFDVVLPGNASGYIITYQRCCRIAGINNLISSSNVGATYIAEIPGTAVDPTGPVNNSAKFVGPDTVIVCAGNPFTYSFAALDPDPQDNLTYDFCSAMTGGSPGAAMPNPPAAPPYSLVPYSNPPFDATAPLGSNVTIDPNSGLISGIAPAAGIYVVTVCVTERRNGNVIAVQRKDLQIKVGDCNIAKASLDPVYQSCDSFTVFFQNLSSSPLINTYFWDFGVPWMTNDTSNIPMPSFTYPDTGTFIVKLVTNRNQQCSDSTTAIVKVYPGFDPDFSFTGACYINPFRFFDNTQTTYGVVNSWVWNFGDPSSGPNNTSTLQNPIHTYSTSGPKTVSLTVGNSKGCLKTFIRTITVLDKPVIGLAFRDTLICSVDDIQLSASGTGLWSWTPLSNITNPNSPNPTVDPPVTTTYYVQLNDNGCINNDSVRVRVVDFVTLQAMPDTTICQTDAAQLYAISDGLQFSWTPAADLNNPSIINPIAIPPASTTYFVTANIGSCTATDNVRVTTVPYPVSNAGPNDTLCYNTSTQLNGSHNGISFTWTPASYLDNPFILGPKATPPRTTAYVLSAYDTLGCPKPGRDTVIVYVRPRLRPFAGRDTIVVVDQPLQFNGSGGVFYLWSPSTGLNSTVIPNPIGIYGPEIDSVRYKLIVTDSAGCSDSAYVTVKVFKTKPTVFVPTAFTPNNDGRNDLIRPIAVGIAQIKSFSIYNRWGQRVFTTTINGHGWDGRIGGKLQGSGVFVWWVEAIDYLGKKFFQKGTVTLIR
jgi:gliding motility-associated-like protein